MGQYFKSSDPSMLNKAAVQTVYTSFIQNFHHFTIFFARNFIIFVVGKQSQLKEPCWKSKGVLMTKGNQLVSIVNI